MKALLQFKTKGFFYILSAYITLLVLPKIFYLFSTFLEIDTPFSVGLATAQRVDVSSRINNFYSIAFIGILISIIVYLIASRFLSKFLIKLTRWREIKTIILLQILLGVFNQLSDSLNYSDTFFHTIILLLFIIEILQYFKVISTETLRNDTLKVYFLSALGFYLFTENGYIIFCFYLLLILFDEKLRSIFNAFHIIIAAFPILLIVTIELTLVFNQRDVFVNSYFVIALALLIVLLFILKIKKVNQLSLTKVLYSWQAPLLIAGAVMYFQYVPIIQQSTELFETANTLNPIMMSATFHQIPLIDYISSHLFSDFFWETLYVFLNGNDGSTAPLIYSALDLVVSILILYYFLIEAFKEKFGVILIILFLPFLYFYIPPAFIYALLPVLFLYKFSKSHRSIHLWYVALSALFLILWRLDLGIAIVFSLGILYILLFIFESKLRKQLLLIGGVFGVFGGIILALYYSLNKDLLQQAIHYFGASQAHGRDVLYYTSSNWFYIDYYILPFCIALILLLLLTNLKQLRNEFYFWPLFLLIGIYFFNYQRGLVRHSFTEMNEYAVSSLAWLIIILFLYHAKLRSRKYGISFIGILMLGGVLLSIHPMKEWTSIINQPKTISINHLPELKSERINRVTNNLKFDNEIYPVVEFLNENLTSSQTFIDFSNSPMLYYYTKKKIPSLFSQYLQNVVDAYLQDKSIKLLKEIDAPFVVFNQNPLTFYDQTDGISNKVRYYRMTPYLYNNYEPYQQFGKFQVWVNKESKLAGEHNSFNVSPEHWNLNYLPFYWKSEKNQQAFEKIKEIPFKGNKIFIDNIQTDDFISFQIDTQEEGNVNVSLEFNDSKLFSLDFKTVIGNHTYKFPAGCAYHISTYEDFELTISTNKKTTINKVIIERIKIEH